MEILKTIPERIDVPHQVGLITIGVENKLAHMHIARFNEPTTTVTVDITLVFKKYATSDTQKAVIKKFFQYLIAEGVGVDGSLVPDVLIET